MEEAGGNGERRFGGAGGAGGAVQLSACLVSQGREGICTRLGCNSNVCREQDLGARAQWLLLGGSGHMACPHGCCGGHSGDAETDRHSLKSGSQPGQTNTIRTPRPALFIHGNRPGAGNLDPSSPHPAPRRVGVSHPTARSSRVAISQHPTSLRRCELGQRYRGCEVTSAGPQPTLQHPRDGLTA